ncbi:MAG: glyoxylate/hydroxypyruvate reductase A [Rhodobacteraceae bacterium]|nr:glyoxylate/hydroxypyruvate reductase A [Paracoccaceae bacterium]
MTPTILFSAGAERFDIYAAPLEDALRRAGLTPHLVTEAAPEAVDYIVVAPGSGISDFRPYTRCKAVLSLWAGVERIVGNPTLSQPLCRMVDTALEAGMVEYVTGHVLRHHLGMDRFINRPLAGWDATVPPLASERPVAMLGLGALGLACARALTGLGFPVLGWSRSPRAVDDIACHHGVEGLSEVLARAQIAVTLLPLTPQTENLLDAAAMARMPQGAVLINPGRGALIDDDALLAALDAGHLGHATLDVFRTEPLPDDHPFRSHPRVTVTPHIAAATRPETAAGVIAENVRRGEAGVPFLHLVDRARGY